MGPMDNSAYADYLSRAKYIGRGFLSTGVGAAAGVLGYVLCGKAVAYIVEEE